MRELSSFTPQVPSTEIPQKTDVVLQRLINEVQEDQWNGCSDIDRATRARAELFSRLRFPVSSIGKPLKKPD